ncbi:MAG: hypothetical protein CBB70_09425 [Planctomycetaceae bacterium TMED10]|nr:MAG: hypothetical protein CBB70_09425 [Planctomycetaceae bacterium TMED10]
MDIGADPPSGVNGGGKNKKQPNSLPYLIVRGLLWQGIYFQGTGPEEPETGPGQSQSPEQRRALWGGSTKRAGSEPDFILLISPAAPLHTAVRPINSTA